MSEAPPTVPKISLRSATLWAAMSQYSGFALQFVASVIIARYFLGPEEIGVFSVAFSAAALVHGLQDFGLTRFLVGAEKLDRPTMRVAFTVSIAVALSIVVVVMLMARPIADFYDNEALFTITLMIGISFIFTPLAVVPMALVQRDMDFRKTAFVEGGAHLVNALVSIAAAWQGYSAMSLAFGVFAYQFTRALLTQFVRPVFAVFPPSLEGAREMFTYGGWSGVLSFTAGFAARAPDLIIGKVISEAALGLYSRATGLALQFRLLVGGPIAAVFYPSLARARDRGENIGAHYLRLTAALCAVTWGAMAGLAAASEPLVLGLYGERWAEVAPLLVWIALAQTFFIAVPMQVDVGYLLGGWSRAIQLTLLDAILSLGILVIAAQCGLWWAAFSRMIHGAIWWAIHAVFIQRLVRFGWGELFAIYARTAIAAAAAALPLLLAYRFWVAPSEMGLGLLMILSAAGVALWYGTLVAVRHPSVDDITRLVSERLHRPKAA
jgi:O-antigen/teichoic acid export membrane protein